MDIKQKVFIVAVLSALSLAAGKFTAGYLSGSMAVVSSGLDSLIDAFMSAMNLIAVRKASEPADDRHQYGHGKAEDLAGTFQSIIVLLTGSFIVFKAVQIYIRQEVITYSLFDLLVMTVSLAFSFVISTILLRTGERTGSNALKADALHYRSDLYSNSGVIAAMALTYLTGITLFDLLFAAAAGFIIILSAVKILRASISGIMDARLSGDIERQIREIIQNIPFPAAGFHKLRTRHSGNSKYIDFHLLACRKLRVDEAHALAHIIEDRIKEKIPSSDIIVHVEPCENDCDLTEITCVLTKKKRATS